MAEITVTYYVARYDEKLRRDYIIMVDEQTGEIRIINAKFRDVIYSGYDWEAGRRAIHQAFLDEFAHVNLPPTRVGKRKRDLTTDWNRLGRPDEQTFWEHLVDQAGGVFKLPRERDVSGELRRVEEMIIEREEAERALEEARTVVSKYETEVRIIEKYRNVPYNNLPMIWEEFQDAGIKDPLARLDEMTREGLVKGKARVSLTDEARGLI